jgi:formylglycine-generating enzyme required for sulfatase activity
MHGNVSEWCEDWYATDPEKAPDPANAEGGQHRVIRGGNWNDRAVNCRSANRERELPAKPSMFVGFRVVLR